MRILQLILLVIFSTHLFADEITLVNDTYAPYVLDAKNPTGLGIDIEIAQKAFEMSGVKVNVKFVPWKRVLVMIENGKGDFTTTLSKNEEREAFVDWSVSYREDSEFVFFAKNPTDISFKSFEEFENSDVRLGAIAGFAYPDKIDKNPKIKLDTSKSIKNSINKLIAGRYQVIILNPVVGGWELKTSGKSNEVTKLPFVFKESDPVYMGFSKKNKLQKYIKIFNNNLAIMKTNGALDKIYGKYTDN